MFKAFRAALEALHDISSGLSDLTQAVHGLPTGPENSDALAERVAVLESTLELNMAEANGLLIKAGSLKQAARASEERERKLAAAKQESEDSLGGEFTAEEIEAAYAAAGFQPGDAVGVPPQEMQPVSPVLEGDPRRPLGALARKFGPA